MPRHSYLNVCVLLVTTETKLRRLERSEECNLLLFLCLGSFLFFSSLRLRSLSSSMDQGNSAYDRPSLEQPNAVQIFFVKYISQNTWTAQEVLGLH